MCIICVKPAGVLQPTAEQLSNMLARNADGAGLVYNLNGCLHLKKGLDLAGLTKALAKVPVTSTCIIHARISTGGGVSAELCHPYPVTDSVAEMRKTSLKLASGYAMAHNGVFAEFTARDGVNDTMQFNANYLAPLTRVKVAGGGSLLDTDIKPVIDRLCGAGWYSSKVAVIDCAGNVVRYGSGWLCDGGLYYSNDTYKSARLVYGDGVYAGWTASDWQSAEFDPIGRRWVKSGEADLVKRLNDARVRDSVLDEQVVKMVASGYTLAEVAELWSWGEL